MTMDPKIASGDRAALERLLGVPEMAWLLARVRSRIAASRGSSLTGVVQLDEPTDAQRSAAVRLVGRPRRPGATLRVDLADVEAILRRGPWPAGLADAVETLTGPVVDPAVERQRTATDWARAADGLRDAVADHPGLGDWWEGFCSAGGLKRAARAEAARTGVAHGPDVGARLVELVASVVAALPSAGEPLPVFARRLTGDAHALDMSRPLGRLAGAAVAAAFAPDAHSNRAAWAAVGVVLSNVASTVLCLGVPGAADPAGALAQASAAALEAMRTARMPLVLTLDQVRSGGVQALPTDQIVHVCENPTIVEVAATAWGCSDAGGSAPVLICTWGQPSTAVVELIAILTGRGAGCRYHGDFDWPGLQIAQALRRRVHWTPWRYTSTDYLEVVEGDLPSLALEGRPVPSPWDPRLAEVMAAHGLAIEEEAMAETLANDLIAASRPTGSAE